jgi:hypothetical protein
LVNVTPEEQNEPTKGGDPTSEIPFGSPEEVEFPPGPTETTELNTRPHEEPYPSTTASESEERQDRGFNSDPGDSTDSPASPLDGYISPHAMNPAEGDELQTVQSQPGTPNAFNPIEGTVSPIDPSLSDSEVHGKSKEKDRQPNKRDRTAEMDKEKETAPRPRSPPEPALVLYEEREIGTGASITPSSFFTYSNRLLPASTVTDSCSSLLLHFLHSLSHLVYHADVGLGVAKKQLQLLQLLNPVKEGTRSFMKPDLEGNDRTDERREERGKEREKKYDGSSDSDDRSCFEGFVKTRKTLAWCEMTASQLRFFCKPRLDSRWSELRKIPLMDISEVGTIREVSLGNARKLT